MTVAGYAIYAAFLGFPVVLCLMIWRWVRQTDRANGTYPPPGETEARSAPPRGFEVRLVGPPANVPAPPALKKPNDGPGNGQPA